MRLDLLNRLDKACIIVFLQNHVRYELIRLLLYKLNAPFTVYKNPLQTSIAVVEQQGFQNIVTKHLGVLFEVFTQLL